MTDEPILTAAPDVCQRIVDDLRRKLAEVTQSLEIMTQERDEARLTENLGHHAIVRLTDTLAWLKDEYAKRTPPSSQQHVAPLVRRLLARLDPAKEK